MRPSHPSPQLALSCRGQGRALRARQDFGHTTRSVGNRELRQPRTRAGGEARHGEQPEPLRAAQIPAQLIGGLGLEMMAGTAP